MNRINQIFASRAKTHIVRFVKIWTGDNSVAGATLHRILGLLVLLGLMLGGVAHAGGNPTSTNAFSALPDAKPAWYISVKTQAQKKPACLHALEHSHESCRACGKSFVLRSTGRPRAKSVVTRSRPSNGFLLLIQLYTATDADNAFPRLTNGSLSQASLTGADIFARTGRLRI